jgi:lipoprotein-releasing system permease protein
MYKPYPLFIGLRYTGTKKRSQLVSFISMISMLGMVIGVALLIVVLSVMNGFDQEMRSRILGLVPHISIISYDENPDWQAVESITSKHTEVEASAPFFEKSAMILRGSDVEPVLIYGIDPLKEPGVSIITDFVEQSVLEQLSTGSDGLILGKALAERLKVTVGSRINIMVPGNNMQASQNLTFKQMRLIAIYSTGTELDQSIALLNINTALSLAKGDASGAGLRIKVRNIFEASRIAWELEQNLPYGYSTSDWTRTHGNLYASIQLSKQLVGLMLVTIIAVAAFNVVSALVMIVTDKRADIAILRTTGASSTGIMMIFMVQGTLIGLIGTLLGVVFGVGLSFFITDIVAWVEQAFQFQFLNSNIYPIDYLPSDIRFEDVFLVAATALVMSLLATIFPAWRASRVQPAEALRYE